MAERLLAVVLAEAPCFGAVETRCCRLTLLLLPDVVCCAMNMLTGLRVTRISEACVRRCPTSRRPTVLSIEVVQSRGQLCNQHGSAFAHTFSRESVKDGS